MEKLNGNSVENGGGAEVSVCGFKHESVRLVLFWSSKEHPDYYKRRQWRSRCYPDDDRWQPNRERALLDEAKVATDGEADSSSEVDEKVVLSTTA